MPTWDKIWEQLDAAILEVYHLQQDLAKTNRALTEAEKRLVDAKRQVLEKVEGQSRANTFNSGVRLQKALKAVKEAGQPVKTPYVVSQIGGTVAGVNGQLYLAVRRGLLVQPESGYFAPLPAEQGPDFLPVPRSDSQVQQAGQTMQIPEVVPPPPGTTRLQQVVKAVEEVGISCRPLYVVNQIGGSMASVTNLLYEAVRRELLMQPKPGYFAPLPSNPGPDFLIRPYVEDRLLRRAVRAVKGAEQTPVRASYILNAIGASSNNGYVLLHRAVRAGLLIKERRGLYTVPPDT